MRFIFFIFTIILTPWLFSSPIPSMGSSRINNPALSMQIFSQVGIEIKEMGPNWQYLNSQLINNLNDQTEMDQSIKITLKKDSPENTRLTFKTEILKKKIPLDAYVKKYFKDYHQYGFELKNTSSYKFKNKNVVILDILQNNKQIQSRHAFYQNDKKILLVSCTDKAEEFLKNFNDCDKVYQSLNWKN